MFWCWGIMVAAQLIMIFKHYQPKIAVASVGYTNRYGHPSLETLSRLDALHIPLYTPRSSQEQSRLRWKIISKTGTISEIQLSG
jgi:beta-lactamase superfamily II metal-dependent hydrolase